MTNEKLRHAMGIWFSQSTAASCCVILLEVLLQLLPTVSLTLWRLLANTIQFFPGDVQSVRFVLKYPSGQNLRLLASIQAWHLPSCETLKSY